MTIDPNTLLDELNRIHVRLATIGEELSSLGRQIRGIVPTGARAAPPTQVVVPLPDDAIVGPSGIVYRGVSMDAYPAVRVVRPEREGEDQSCS